ncbi:MIP/aquaporin family protein [Microbulbifer sp. CnH-101-G]|uniref:MIP/aquaporin family protein n=1 Tax=Microbulbifer sp. CnH-101-G TaxID=3243393 RepID=UPI00403A78B2
MNYSFIQKLSAELIGTFILATAVLTSLTPSNPFPIATPIAAGLALGLCVYIIGGISGCHVNPAISFSMLISKKLSFKDFIGYVIVQVCGGILALLMVTIYVPLGQEGWLVSHKASIFSGIGEGLGTAFFSFGVMATAHNKDIGKATSGIVVGSSLLLGLIVSHNASYGILNPAVALATKAWSWDYLLMPFVGASVGALVSYLLFRPRGHLQES